ncbi:hypothetical protein [Streptomyces sulphureus]|uniref:hypothetical protein n=1 Tax=Streptomyces sulphureus TaxID=47758 RepID=UPI00037785D7|nr:hypothetical protein [Streptomyces sulphureus]
MRLNAGTPRDGIVLTQGRLDALRKAPSDDDPVATAALSLLDDPLAEIVVEVTGPDGRRAAAFALGSDLCAVILSRPTHDPELAAVTPESVPAVTARTVGLGPAPYVDIPPLTVPEADIDALAVPPPQISPALAAHPVGTALRVGDWRLWRLQAAAPSDEGDGSALGARLDVLGARGYGWWVLEESAEGVLLSPTTATALWRGLSGVLG